MKQRKKLNGFTLVEVMVSLTLLGLILLMVLGTFRLSLSSWERVERQNDHSLRIRSLQRMMLHQIKSIFPYRVRTEKAEGDYLAFEGKSKSLRFVSDYSIKSKKSEGFFSVTYLWKDGERLEIYEEKVLRKDFFEDPLKEEFLIATLSGISNLTFEYLKEEEDQEEGVWVEEWETKGLDPLPQAIRISLQIRDEKKEPVTSSIQIALPSRKFEDIRPMIRGLGRRTIRERLLGRGAE